MRISKPFLALSALSITLTSAYAQDGSAVQQRLQSEYTLTQPTADNTTIVTAGSVIVLKKGNLLMAAISENPIVCQNTYKDGRLTQSLLCKTWKVPGASEVSGGTLRTFVAGEKIWVTQILVKGDGVVFSLLSDPFGDTRYKGYVRFPFPKGSIPPVDQVDRTVADVFQVDSNSTASAPPAGGNGRLPTPEQASAPPPALAVPPPPALAVPPPPADAPAPEGQSVAVGQTPDQVVALLGKPIRTVKQSATQQMYVYKQMKIIFVNSKVSDVQ